MKHEVRLKFTSDKPVIRPEQIADMSIILLRDGRQIAHERVRAVERGYHGDLNRWFKNYIPPEEHDDLLDQLRQQAVGLLSRLNVPGAAVTMHGRFLVVQPVGRAASTEPRR